MALVSVNDLHKSFGDLEVLKGIDLDVEAGEVVAIIGRSGSGKSTFLRCLNQLERHDKGTIRIADQYLDGKAMSPGELSKNVGMVFQSFNLFPHKTVGENVMLAPVIVRQEDKAKTERVAREVLDKVGLLEKFDAYPAQLSGGQQQRVAIARALAMNPKVLLCDEVTSALDPELVGEVLRVLEALAREGMTLILVTHEMKFAQDVSNRVVFMHQGRIHEQGDPQTLFKDPKTAELRQFIASVL
ncbi:amino acid ABC transporter ATP-binding protein [Halomonas sp. McH1-25]|uniref:amino acid ABC transporter ATP-binding protein n=1 Tax=unclassified Halomonas TaxID=2609666 RepID=UPI001EF6F689|nr:MULTISPECIES: amino acid ABC transporter ATP-binding protein [unclassified Halomonas]MCG7599570.1 amino acid ABC transporter ATP-binding protein [Halomonas sp. McH1-25]MCP1342157.1 amino acid ABC transporter ATP-binding protein [Halomonas sp. FL8]MCP1362368.1 amino acid ABC transporter ATP-binding protein [Halomonas sp. BBD45]MCP1366418.1 amino acid ABC transporter ATP-binding protein [Halomonas sp. BBD48]